MATTSSNQVKSRPNKRRRRSVAEEHSQAFNGYRNYKLENQMERLVFHLIEEVYMMDSQDRFCQCEQFQKDVAAIVLNQFYPRYATSFEGAIYTLDNLQKDQDLQVKMIRQVAAAMEVVASNPHCQDPQCPILHPPADGIPDLTREA